MIDVKGLEARTVEAAALLEVIAEDAQKRGDTTTWAMASVMAGNLRDLASAPHAPAPEGVAGIVPNGCSGSALAFTDGVLHVSKDGSGYIAVDEDRWTLEDDRAEGPDGPEGSVHWITRFPPGEMQALRDFLNGAKFASPSVSPPFEFDRYVNGVLMAEGVEIGLQDTFEEAAKVAARIASRGPNGEVPVLVLRGRASPPVSEDAVERASMAFISACADDEAAVGGQKPIVMNLNITHVIRTALEAALSAKETGQ